MTLGLSQITIAHFVAKFPQKSSMADIRQSSKRAFGILDVSDLLQAFL